MQTSGNVYLCLPLDQRVLDTRDKKSTVLSDHDELDVLCHHKLSPVLGLILHFIHREWTDDGQLWVQYVSSTPATRLDVTNLQEQLDQKLQQRQARETGICPVREELYSQCFGMYNLE